MHTQPLHSKSSLRRGRLLAGGVLALLLAGPVLADDVDLVSQGQQNPYVFLLLDVSGSMNWSIPCTPEDANPSDGSAPSCSYICTTGDCEPPLVSDDPNNRLYVAKDAIYTLMDKVQGFNLGFATFDQDNLRVQWKHWWYELTGRTDGLAYTGLPLANGYTILAPPTTDLNGNAIPGERHIFGNVHNCDPNGNGPSGVGCYSDNPAYLDNPWSEERVRRYAKLDDDNDTPRTYYVFAPDGTGGGSKYRVEFKPDTSVVQRPGDPTVTVLIDVVRCANYDCTNSTPEATDLPLTFTRRDDLIHWDWDVPGTVPAPPEHGYLFDIQYIVEDGQSGWDPVDDTSADEYPTGTYNLKYLPVTDPLGRGNAFRTGDILPWDWTTDHRRDIQLRMAPNVLVDPAAVPDFGVARYFQDFRQGTEQWLRLKTMFFDPTNPNSPDAKPLMPAGGTPTGAAMASFRSWFAQWVAVADDPNNDKDLDCKTLNLIVITDGQATDGNQACSEATSLLDFTTNGTTYHVRTFALALGDKDLASSGYTNVLNCMADNGGTSADPGIDLWPPGGDGNIDKDGNPTTDGPGPLFARDKEEMIRQLEGFFETIGGTSKSFSGAAVQRSSSTVEEKVVISSFVPLSDASSSWPEGNVWPGRVDAYLKPVPTKQQFIDGSNRTVPNRQKTCGPSDDRNCLVWDAAKQVALQAPDAAQLTANDLNLGNNATERRVYFAEQNLVGSPDRRVMLDIPTANADWENLTEALGICTADPNDVTVLQTCAAAVASQAKAIDVLKFIYQKKTFEDPDTLQMTDYVLGEVFHSTPTLLGSPDNFRYFVQNRNNYRDYFTEHRFRRKMLAVNSNDGQLHVFNAGIYRGDADKGEFDNGEGQELFAFQPREPMPQLTDMADPSLRTKHRYLNDGSPVHFDVFIDPTHNGTPDPAQREWRSLVLSGLREGGASYYAVDMTGPDNTDSDGVPDISSTTSDYLPTASGFPELLWEFRDRGNCAAFNLGQTDPANFPNDTRCDDDQNKLPDLGDTWSTPNVGLVRVCTDANCTKVVEKSVMVTGGGMDPENKGAADQSGNYLYMVDIETGKAIYKRRLGTGATPSEPAAVDSNQDGMLDTIFIGTTAGELFKINLLDPKPLVALGGALQVTDAAWKPFKIFDTGGRPIYFPPAVIFVPSLSRFALAFGTGDREDLWSGVGVSTANGDGRFYVMLDKFDVLDPLNPPTPLTETNLTRIDLTSGDSPGANFLDPGWYFPLQDDERLITPAFSITGITVFTTFVPEILQVQNAICASRGDSNVYVVFTVNGNAVADTRFETVEGPLSEPVPDPGGKIDGRDEPPQDDCGGANQPPCDEPPPPSCTDSARSKKIAEELMQLFPRTCRFTGRVVCLVATEDTGNIKVLAPVPICTIERNWKEL